MLSEKEHFYLGARAQILIVSAFVEAREILRLQADVDIDIEGGRRADVLKKFRKIYGEDCDFCKYNYLQCSNYYIGENDLKLMKALFNAGTEHRKYDRMIQVWMDIEAPLYWWKEFDTYKIGTVANSCSTMHKIAEKEFTVDDFSHEHLNYSFISDDGEEEPVEFEEYYLASQDVLDITIRALNKYRDMYIKTKDKKYWWQLIQLLPSSYNQKRTVMMNYEVIARIIEQRSHHKLDEWHQLIDVLGGLPYMQELMK